MGACIFTHMYTWAHTYIMHRHVRICTHWRDGEKLPWWCRKTSDSVERHCTHPAAHLQLLKHGKHSLCWHTLWLLSPGASLLCYGWVKNEGHLRVSYIVDYGKSTGVSIFSDFYYWMFKQYIPIYNLLKFYFWEFHGSVLWWHSLPLPSLGTPCSI